MTSNEASRPMPFRPPLFAVFLGLFLTLLSLWIPRRVENQEISSVRLGLPIPYVRQVNDWMDDRSGRLSFILPQETNTEFFGLRFFGSWTINAVVVLLLAGFGRGFKERARERRKLPTPEKA